MENEIEVKKIDSRERTETVINGVWRASGNSIVWQETTIEKTFDLLMRTWKITKKETVLKTPEDVGYLKEVESVLILSKTVKTDDELEGETTYLFAQPIKFRVREGFEDIFLKVGDDKKVYRADLRYQNSCQVNLASTNDVLVEKGKPKKISEAEAVALLKLSGYFYGKSEKAREGEYYLYGVSCR